MVRILAVWEMGGGYGHVNAFHDLALALSRRGHEVCFALRDLRGAETLLGRHGFPAFQAPIRRDMAFTRNPPTSFAELLANNGFLDPQGLTALVRGWRSLFGAVRPDAMVVNHSPTALVAATGMGFARILQGTGFVCPPPVSPLPAMGVASGAAERLASIEAQVLTVVNDVLSRFQVGPLASLGSVYAVEAELLCTFPELDPFESQRDVCTYWGPRTEWTQGVKPAWPAAPGDKRIFAYLKPTSPHFERMMAALAGQPHSVLVHAPGLTDYERQHYCGPGLSVSDRQIALERVHGECDLTVCHAGHGTTASALLAGRPLVLLPMQLEQTLTARRVAVLGAGVHIEGGMGDFPRVLTQASKDPSYGLRAAEFARCYADFDPERQVAGLCARIERLAGVGRK
jgi:UDP:flavonoid glycosyltransferase YjiC (YdhE family)